MLETMLDMSSHWFWITACVLFLTAEILVPGTLFMLIFALAALLTALITLFTDSVWLLSFLFGVSALIGVMFVKPLLKRYVSEGNHGRPSNIDAIIGSEGRVVKSIHPPDKGTVKVGHEEWLAVSEDRRPLEAGTMVTVKKIEGATLIVEGVSS